jgi:hypothetical protein
MVRTALYYSPVFLEYDTGEHVENKARLESILNFVESRNSGIELVDAVLSS